jgi:hypothetical protein
MAKSYALHRVRDTREIQPMPQPLSAYDLHQRERWTRHDAHLWIRHDAARFYKPGTDLADVFPTLQRQREAAEDAAFAAKIAASRRLLAALRAEVDEMKAARARRRLEEAKYSPSQPRVPSGNSRGGQWTAGGTGGSIAPMGSVVVGDPSGSSELSDLQIAPGDASTDGVQLAGEPVDLLEQQQRGGHAISEHAGMTYDYLKSRVRENAQNILDRGDDFRGASVGSFTSVQSANRLVNSTISDNEAKIDQAMRDGEPFVLISKSFKSPTGYEAYLARAHAEPVMRDTFSVEVLIRPDPGSTRGWRVHTAYPVR